MNPTSILEIFSFSNENCIRFGEKYFSLVNKLYPHKYTLLLFDKKNVKLFPQVILIIFSSFSKSNIFTSFGILFIFFSGIPHCPSVLSPQLYILSFSSIAKLLLYPENIFFIF